MLQNSYIQIDTSFTKWRSNVSRIHQEKEVFPLSFFSFFSFPFFFFLLLLLLFVCFVAFCLFSVVILFCFLQQHGLFCIKPDKAFLQSRKKRFAFTFIVKNKIALTKEFPSAKITKALKMNSSIDFYFYIIDLEV